MTLMLVTIPLWSVWDLMLSPSIPPSLIIPSFVHQNLPSNMYGQIPTLRRCIHCFVFGRRPGYPKDLKEKMEKEKTRSTSPDQKTLQEPTGRADSRTAVALRRTRLTARAMRVALFLFEGVSVFGVFFVFLFPLQSA